MEYNAEQKIYFQLQTVLQIIDELDCEIHDLGMSNQLDRATDLLDEISTAAYKKAGRHENN